MFDSVILYFKSKFSKSKNEHSSVIYRSPEEWEGVWGNLQKEKENYSPISLNEYLSKNGHREAQFKELLEKEFQKDSSVKKQNRTPAYFGLKPALASVIILIFGILLYTFYSSQEKTALKYLPLKGSVRLERNGQIIQIREKEPFEKNDRLILKDEESLEIVYSDSLKFRLEGSADMEIREIPESENKIHFLIHLGTIEIFSNKPKNRPEIAWITDRFTYIPTGTVARLKVGSTAEELTVSQGSFICKDRIGKVRQIKESESFKFSEADLDLDQESNDIEGAKKNAVPNPPRKEDQEIFGIVQTVRLKNGEKHTGIYYKKNGKTYLNVPGRTMELSDSEIESVE
ncbi:MAG TPA: hypothetical protein PL048_00700 [Leptospiraceae bacterium]|nr:hypothetical protein [Leptospiraceae bacterium]HMY65762.1 hypothetical protein [Leptospiraceae bacterium]HMZ57261.1 hypothetical protein [Leptospiraceae bacterium]HNF13915.1 hypothetical protein [Leptospiraceae bacterium]HNF24488.1 hypothetical protein [Leptospiraceae bacterium]